MNVKAEVMQSNTAKKYKLVIAVEELTLIKYKGVITILLHPSVCWGFFFCIFYINEENIPFKLFILVVY